MSRRRFAPALLLVAAAACADATSPANPARLAPLIEPTMDFQTRLVDNEWIVVLRDDADEEVGARRAGARGGLV
ncbi:MAG: hypothetical protein HUU26_00905, partial [Gemmatimonadaceae bacterium]|nr:hypothetical protein [Gemmatimonadaceae bacterium]